MSKSEVQAEAKHLREHEATSDEGEEIRSPSWQPGYRKRFPTFGALSLLAVLLCALGSVAVLIGSDRVSSSRWTPWLAPNVCLQGLNALSNIMLAIAIAQGIAITWWRKAMRGASVAELHRSWEFSSGFSSVLLNFWSFDKVALAALAMKVAIIDGLLFQRATSTYVQQDPPAQIETLAIAATEFPSTGYVLSNNSFGGQASCGCFMIGDGFTPVVNTWESSNGFYRDYNDWFRSDSNYRGLVDKATAETGLHATESAVKQHCKGMCYAHMEAIGFEISCYEEVVQQDIAVDPINRYEQAGNGTSGDSEDWTVTIFNSSFTLYYPDSSLGLDTTALMMTLNYFQAQDPYNPSSFHCAGRVYNKKCVLRPALVTYPVKIMNYSNPHIINGVSLESRIPGMNNMMDIGPPKYNPELKQAEGFKVGPYINVNDTRDIGSLTSLGGVASALHQFLGAYATITYNGEYQDASVWALKQQGTLAQTMMYGPPVMGSCDCSFKDESLDTIIEAINQLTFMTAIGMVDNSTFMGRRVEPDETATIRGVGKNSSTSFRALTGTMQVSDVVYYRTNYYFMGFAVLSTLVCIALVIPSYWRYGELGRDVTLGPIEVASAFRAPMLTEGRANAAEAGGNIKELIKDVGHRKVMYGFVDEREDHAEDHLRELPRRSRNSVKLGISEPEKVRPASGVWSGPNSPRSPTSPMSPRLFSPKI